MITTTIPVIIEQHAEDAAFNWLLRNYAVHEPHYSLQDLSKLDDRVEANIDGLRIAGDDGWKICKEALMWEESGEIFTTALMAFESSKDDRIEAVVAVVNKLPELSDGMVSALGWLPYEKCEVYANRFLSEESALLKRIGLAANAIHRKDPGKALYDAFSSTDLKLKARALRAIGELGRKDLLSLLNQDLYQDDEDCRFYAAWSAAILGEKASIPILQEMAKTGSSYSEKACKMVFRMMNFSDAINWQSELSKQAEYKRISIIGAGVIGDPVLIPGIIQMMEVPELARVAAESFTMITGVDIAYDDLETDGPEGFESGPTESPEEEDVELDQDEDLPWPDQELIHGWWEKNRRQFKNGIRYLLGKPVGSEWLHMVLINGLQRQREAAALELTMMQPGTPLFEVRAPGFRQKKLLGL